MGEVGLNYCRSHSCADSNCVEYHDAKRRNRKGDSVRRVKVYNETTVAGGNQNVHRSRQKKRGSDKTKALIRLSQALATKGMCIICSN